MHMTQSVMKFWTPKQIQQDVSHIQIESVVESKHLSSSSYNAHNELAEKVICEDFLVERIQVSLTKMWS